MLTATFQKNCFSDTLNFCKLKLATALNVQKNKTEEYEDQNSSFNVIRRGCKITFLLQNNFQGDFDVGSYINFKLDNYYEKIVYLHNNNVKNSLDYFYIDEIHNISSNIIQITINVGHEEYIGMWDVNIIGKSTLNKPIFSTTVKIFIIFNPYDTSDPTFLDNEQFLSAYLLRDFDSVCYISNEDDKQMINCKPWRHCQFTIEAVEVTSILLKKLTKYNFLSISKRNDIINITRKLSFAINEWLLLGNWDRKSYHCDDRKPEEWDNSLDIFLIFIRNQNPVRWGQCFTFAPLFTSILRCLGIPTRTITCSDAGHDVQGSLVLERRILRKIKNGFQTESEEGIWTFHCWCEIWIKRYDLSCGIYDGWQVVDATPQTTSNGLRQRGPYPVKALFDGVVNLKYDGHLMFSEMNADIIDRVLEYDPIIKGYRDLGYQFDSHENPTQRTATTGGILVCPSTINPFIVDDITENYKPKDNTIESRKQIITALKSCKFYNNEHPVLESEQLKIPSETGHLILINTNSTKMNVGDTWIITVSFNNFTAYDEDVHYDFSISVCDNDKNLFGHIFTSSRRLVIPFKTKTIQTFTVDPSIYHIKDFNTNMIYIIKVKATNCLSRNVISTAIATRISKLAKEINFPKRKWTISKLI
uniref:TGc domain-containing protein n=1 Tax=Strongyloides stercoralis TaxID=6248 RepID=A0A0K0DVA8_STRER